MEVVELGLRAVSWGMEVREWGMEVGGLEVDAGGQALDPVALSKQADLASSPSSGSSRRIVARTQRVLDASHDSVVKEIKEFAGQRGGGESPFGWRRYMVSQQDFIRFCCHATIRALLSGQDETVLAGVTR